MKKPASAIQQIRALTIIFVITAVAAFGSTVKRSVIAKTSLDTPSPSLLRSRSRSRHIVVRHRVIAHRRTVLAGPFAGHSLLPLVDPTAGDQPGIEDPV